MRPNNFDLIRLVAALQVVVVHAAEHLDLPWFKSGLGQSILELLQWFPGVPIFFVISGFLISRSFEKQDTVGEYIRNRVLRIYPALWTCFFVSIALIAFLSPGTFSSASLTEFFTWTVAQLTFFQFFNPDFLRTYGVGVVNGSLWTIPVELQFYTAIPVIYLLSGGSKNLSNWKLLVWTFIFLCGNQFSVALAPYYSSELWFKLLRSSMIPYFWLFLLGVLAQRNWQKAQYLFKSRVVTWLTIYVSANLLLGSVGFTVGTNNPSPMLAVLLAGLTLAAAFSFPQISDFLLRGNDISYGVYIYHMLVINAFAELGYTESIPCAFFALVMTLIAATSSWVLVESPCLRKKSSSIRHPIENQGKLHDPMVENTAN